MRAITVRIASLAAAAGILFSSSAAISATPSSSAQPAASSISWTTLSMMTPAGAIGLAGAAAQDAEVPPPPPPPEPNGVAGVPLPVLILWIADIAALIYIATRNHNHLRIANSPG